LLRIPIRLIGNAAKARRGEVDKRFRLPFDRRSGEDRRKRYRLGYFLNGGVERRSGEERRSGMDRRADWISGAAWSSACIQFVDI